MSTAARSTRETVGHASDLAVGSMKLARVGERRIVVVRTPSGIHALDNACPHQGYGLVTGSLDGELLTCQWHNWKYRVSDGVCVIGEENVPCHGVEVIDDEVIVTVVEPTVDEQRAVLWPSLRSGIEKDYQGQVARDALRLLGTAVSPTAIIWEGVKLGAPRNEWGLGHEMATSADCLALAGELGGERAKTAIVQALSGLAEATRAYPARPLPEADGSIDLVAAIEAEDHTAAMARVVADVRSGRPVTDVATDFIEAVSRHHYDYGHGAIYTQKAFELLAEVAHTEAEHLLPHLAATLAWGTREDTLPYMNKAMAELDGVDLDAVAAGGGPGDDAARDVMVATLLDAPEAPIAAAARFAAAGAGVTGLLDAVTLAVSYRLLRHDLDLEFRLDDPFGWLDITHGLTYSRAARWAWGVHPSPAAARLALFTVWLAHDTGRGERRNHVAAPVEGAPSDLSLGEAILRRDESAAVGAALDGGMTEVTRAMAEASLYDHAGSFIVQAHLIKTARAAGEEAATIGSSIPLAAAARFLAAPRLERFAARNAVESDHFISTGRPPLR